MPLFITEYRDMARDINNRDIAAGMEPAVAEQTLTLSASSGQTAIFNAQTAFVMVHAQEASCLKWGTNPTAVVTAQRMAAGETRYYGIPPNKSFRLAGILGV